MKHVDEHLNWFPFDQPATVLTRDETHLLAPALPGPFGAYGADTPRLDVIHLELEYQPGALAAPRILYASPEARIEWQQMDNRQPIFHRNLDVDEMSYQINGDRTLMSEHGTTELRTGDFVRIPVGVCHDNWGRKESHLLWYVLAPCVEQLAPDRVAKALIPPFEGWENSVVNEVTTDRLGLPGETAAQRADERLILEEANKHMKRLAVVRPESPSPTVGGVEPVAPHWIWKSARTWVGWVDAPATQGRVYVRHANADEIQYQVSGERVLVTQLGTVHVAPGDIVRIPAGIAFTTISAEPHRFITTLAAGSLVREYPASRASSDWDATRVAAHRETTHQLSTHHDEPNHGGTT